MNRVTDPDARGRRQFLKGSLVLGAVSTAAPVLSRVTQDEKPAPAPATGMPTSAAAHAETGTVPMHRSEGDDPIVNPGSDYMVDLMRGAQIKYIAAIPGSAFRGLHESIVNYGGNKAPELVVCVHEEISAGIAHGYAKAAGHPMASLIHTTVGLQHASMAVYNAWCDRVPMMLIVGNSLDETKRRPGVEWFHSAADVGAFVRDYVKWDDTPVSIGHYGESFMRAMQVAMTPPCDPVLIVCDTELQEEPIANRAALPVPKLALVAPPGGNPAAIGQAADMLLAASQPVIVADRAARTADGMRSLVQLAELLNAPVIDRGGRLNMPTTHYLAQTGLQGSLLASADLILGLELTDIWGVAYDVPDKRDREAVRKIRPDAKVIGISASYGSARSNVQDVQRYLAHRPDARRRFRDRTAAAYRGDRGAADRHAPQGDRGSQGGAGRRAPPDAIGRRDRRRQRLGRLANQHRAPLDGAVGPGEASRLGAGLRREQHQRLAAAAVGHDRAPPVYRRAGRLRRRLQCGRLGRRGIGAPRC